MLLSAARSRVTRAALVAAPLAAPALRRAFADAAAPAAFVTAAQARWIKPHAPARIASADMSRARVFACCRITRAQLKQLLAGPAAARPSVVDLREAEELAAAKLPSGVTHLPLRCAA